MKTPTWGYSKADAKIFEIEPGESLPSGYYDSPVAMEEAETKPKAVEVVAVEPTVNPTVAPGA